MINVLGYGYVRLPGSRFESGVTLNGKRSGGPRRRREAVSNNCAALDMLLTARGERRLRRVTDYLAGVGLWATILDAHRPRALTLVERDGACAEHLRSAFPRARVVRDEPFAVMTGGNAGDLACADVPVCTMKTVLGEEWPRRLLSGAGDVILSDSAGSKIHMNYRRYGLARPDYRDYLDLYNQSLRETFGWGIVAAVACGSGERHPGGYLLLRAGAGETFEMRVVDRPDAVR
jgi:hypothetical protein